MFVNMVLEACRLADRYRMRSAYGVFASVVEEVGELGTEIAINMGDSYKDVGPDGVSGEIVDALGALVDLAYVYDKGISEGILCRMVAPKLDKWLSKLSGKEQRVFADRFGGVSYLTGCCEPTLEVGGALMPNATETVIGVVQRALDCLGGNEKPYSGPNVTIDVRGLQAVEALKKIQDAGTVPSDTDVIFDYRQLNDLVANKGDAAAIGAEIGAAITANWKSLFEAVDDHASRHGFPFADDAVANVKMDVSVTLPADEIVLNIVPDQHVGIKNATEYASTFLDPEKVKEFEASRLRSTQKFIQECFPGNHEDGVGTFGREDVARACKLVEVEKPTAYDSLIGSVGTVRVPESLASGGQLDAGRVSSLLGAYDAVVVAAGRVADARHKPVSLPDVVREPVRMLFSELALGARFRYVVDGKVHSRVWIKLSDFSSRDEKIGLIAEYDANFITHRNWVGQSLCCAEDTVEKCAALVVELVG